MSALHKPIRGPHALHAQVIAELRMRLTHGETALLVFGIPIALLLFFSLVDVVDVPTETNVEFVFPGILALAVLSTAFTSTAIATAFERAYGVLKRVGATPLGRTRLIGAKIIALAITQVVQVVVLSVIAATLGFTSISVLNIFVVVAAGAATTSACVGIALVLASTLRPEAVLGVANGIYVLLLLLSGLVFELDRLPVWLANVSQLLPITALAEIYRAVLATQPTSIGLRPVVVLAVWACAAPLVARRTFKWS